MKKGEYVCAFFIYPIISFLITLVLIMANILVGYVNCGFVKISLRDICFILTIVFSMLTVLGMIDGSFWNSNIGFSFIKYLRLVNKDELKDLRNEEEVKGRIAKGAETIEMALTLISLMIYVFQQ